MLLINFFSQRRKYNLQGILCQQVFFFGECWKGEEQRRRANVSLNLFEDQILKQGAAESAGDAEAKAPGVCNLLTRVRLDRSQAGISKENRVPGTPTPKILCMMHKGLSTRSYLYFNERSDHFVAAVRGRTSRSFSFNRSRWGLSRSAVRLSPL